jgi:hypothetical protein
MAHDCSHPVVMEGVYPFDARGVAKRFRHAAIFRRTGCIARRRDHALFAMTMIRYR